MNGNTGKPFRDGVDYDQVPHQMICREAGPDKRANTDAEELQDNIVELIYEKLQQHMK